MPSRGDLLETIEARWTLRIVLCLNVREHRFSDLRAAMPQISAKTLTDRLRALESAGLIEQQDLPPPYASQVYLLAKMAVGLACAGRSRDLASRKHYRPLRAYLRIIPCETNPVGESAAAFTSLMNLRRVSGFADRHANDRKRSLSLSITHIFESLSLIHI